MLGAISIILPLLLSQGSQGAGPNLDPNIAKCLDTFLPSKRTIHECTTAAQLLQGPHFRERRALALAIRSSAYELQGDLTRSARDFAEATLLSRFPRDILLRLAIIDFETGKLERALERETELAVKYPADYEILCELGSVNAILGRNADAYANFDAAIGLQPNNPLALNNKAYLLFQNDRLEEALPLANRAHASSPTTASYNDTRANILSAMGRTDEAYEAFKSTVQLADHARCARLTALLAKAGYLKRGSKQSSVDELLAALKQCTNNRCRLIPENQTVPKSPPKLEKRGVE